MKTLARIGNIGKKSSKATKGQYSDTMAELRQNITLIKDRLKDIDATLNITVEDHHHWVKLLRQTKNKIARPAGNTEADTMTLGQLMLMGERAVENSNERMEALKANKEALEELKQRIIKSLTALEVEQNLSMVSSYSNNMGVLSNAGLNDELREIRRLTETSQALAEIKLGSWMP